MHLMKVELMTNTQVFTTVESLRKYLLEEAKEKSVGFVPTMGALHEGHVSLVHEAEKMCDVVVVSIFVNPTQFNDAGDLTKYPRTLDADLEILSKNSNCIVFHPSESEMYPENHHPKKLDLGKLGNVLEGRFREGHFDGVVEVVYRLFEIVRPTHAFFGEKDFQQLAVIRKMVRSFELPIKIIGCPIYREKGGLAASSRNQRLSESQKAEALVLYRSMDTVRNNMDNWTPCEAKAYVEKELEESTLELEYIDFIDADSFESVTSWTNNTRACIAAYCGSVRLIDNLSMS